MTETFDTYTKPIHKAGKTDEFVDIKIHRTHSMDKQWISIYDKKVIELTSDSEGEIQVELLQQPMVSFTGDPVTSPIKREKITSAWLASEGTNWKVENSYVVFTNPTTGESVKLPKADPKKGTYVPSGVPAIYGQPEMMFTLAMSMHYGVNSLLKGPTGTGKTTAYAFLAQLLGYNFMRFQVDPKTEGSALIGDYLPVGVGDFRWTDGPLTEAVRLSEIHPTIFIFDELSRIGNVAEMSRVYSLLDDSRRLLLTERTHEKGIVEIVTAKDLFIGATMNPADDENADYIGVRELDPALEDRFPFCPEIGYPKAEIEIKALRERVKGLSLADATDMVEVGNRIRNSAIVNYPFSFRALIAWGQALPYFGFKDGARVAFIQKANAAYRPAILDILIGVR